ncbi:FadR/GntR family transcriptional regulator [Cohnella fermenti]|uniref:FadR family transcriptional regulator n=1 Tax=Cohnella fermenti TaxID=2565925 RepID=A0A4S4BST4_9BACL|nr:GntR family transcriptional regulator [Cohnella fermenti]THF77311.1 FadR family transcriptional regulator [Cohnella fermenti]
MKPIAKSERYTLTELIVRNLKTYIINRELKPGDKLPAERELCQTLGVSRAVLREALRSLESAGLLHIRHGEGSYVAVHFFNPLYEQLHFIRRMDPKRQSDVQGIRYIIEASALEPASRLDAREWDKLLGLAERFESADLSDAASRSELDTQLHLALIRSLGNRTLEEMAEAFLRLDARIDDTDGEHRAHAREHDLYLGAIREGDMKLAKELLGKHLSTSCSIPRP